MPMTLLYFRKKIHVDAAKKNKSHPGNAKYAGTVDDLSVIFHYVHNQKYMQVLVRSGASVFSCGTSTRAEDATLTKRLFTAVGLCEEVPEV